VPDEAGGADRETITIEPAGRTNMHATRRLTRLLLAVIGIVLVATTGRSETKQKEIKLPGAVKKTFDAEFPKAGIEKVEVEEENGVTVYDIEFKEGETEKETDITAEGIMLEFTIVIAAKDVPAAAMKPIEKAAKGAKMKRIERVVISYETKAGKTIKLPKAVTHYAVEMTKGKHTAEIVVTPDGTIVEEPQWEEPKKE
jgi:hypothetical protein